MKQKIIDNIISFIHLTRENGIKDPILQMWAYNEKKDTIKLIYDYKDIEIHVEFFKDGDTGLIIYDNVNKCTIKNALVETKQELLEEMLKLEKVQNIANILKGDYLPKPHNNESKTFHVRTGDLLDITDLNKLVREINI